MYNAKQAAKLIGCGTNTIKKLAAHGILTDKGVFNGGEQRHHARFVEKEVKRVANVYARNIDFEVLKGRLVKEVVKAVEPTPPAPVPQISPNTHPVAGINSRLDAIQNTLTDFAVHLNHIVGVLVNLEALWK